MSEAAHMFRPLSAEETAAVEVAGRVVEVKPRPIVPVPEDAPAMQYRHPKRGAPSKVWPYHNAGGQVVGLVLRWDFTGADDKPDKAILPVCYCDLGDGRRAWRSVGMSAPRSLLRLPDILARPDARVLVVEGEKAADAAAALFPDLVATTPPHGALSPHKADWTLLHGRHVVVWPDNDEAGAKYAEAVARLCMDSGVASMAVVAVPANFPAKWDVADATPGSSCREARTCERA